MSANVIDKKTRFRLSEVALALHEDEAVLSCKVAAYLKCSVKQLSDCKIVRSSIDARRKGRVLRIYTMEFGLASDVMPMTVATNTILAQWENDRRLQVVVPSLPVEIMVSKNQKRVVVVGMGPAGLFAALWLVRAGHKVVVVERGQPVEQRILDVEMFWNGATLQPNSNVQFGEGGAGTFSDGKLTTRIKHPLTQQILQILVDFGAPADILIQAKPHIGTDKLCQVLQQFRQQLLQLGVEIKFASCVTDIIRSGDIVSSPNGVKKSSNNVVQSVIVNDGTEITCDAVVLAIGHSARDTYKLLEKRGFNLQPKAFAMGLRVEHPAELINQIQYGKIADVAGRKKLPTADYRLAYNDKATGRGAYSFCMCPGGQVVQSSSESEMVVVNGMSDYTRAATRSNSALVVTIRTEDFADSSPLAGVRFQQHWERQAFIAGGGDYRVPAQNMLDFLGNGKTKGGANLNSSCRPSVYPAQLSQILPGFVTDGLRQALPAFERKMRGFITAEATLTGIESRTSAPLRILRDANGQALGWSGVYPAGEGSGYAGGIMSAAMDGINAAIAIA